MKNAGLFSTLFLDKVQNALAVSDDAQGRLVTLSQNWQRRDAATIDGLWRSFIKAALGNLGFVVNDTPLARGLYGLFEDYSFTGGIALLYVVEPGANLGDESVGRFWPAKLITALRERKLNWGILTNGAMWRLYSTKSAKPYEDHVELNLGGALGAVGTLDSSQEGAYALFERFFHADSFTPRDRVEYDTDRVAQLKTLGLKAKRQKQQKAAASDDENGQSENASADSAEREAGIYLCRLDLDGEVSEAILEAQVKEPLLAQVDNVLRYICNGFIADTPRADAAYTEEERREVFESSVKLLYRCLFLFYAEARHLLPSEDRHREIYAPHSINTLCREARKFRWNERTDTAGYDLWQQLKGLVQAVNEGDPTYGVMGYNGGLFDDEEERFLGQHRLRNDFLANALYGLAFVDPVNTAGGQRENEYAIPYEDLEVRHLGEMYESILEFKVRLADTDYLRRRSKNGWQTLPAAGQKTQDGDIRIKAGDIFFGETVLERKQSGSYYTPESLVRFLVGKAVIAPFRERWESGYRQRFTAYLDQTRTGYDDAERRGAQRSAQELVNQFVHREIITYKVCDPAMGSGHFLVAAANLMADFVVELLACLEPLSGVASENTGSPNHWRRLITRHCLYGADLNPLAVNLAKLALWLNCFAREHKLTFLDLHLRPGNSLIGLRDLAALRNIPERRKDTRRDRDEAEEAAQELPLRLDDELTAQLDGAARAISAVLDFAEDDTDRQRDAFEEASRSLHSAFDSLADLHIAYLMDASLRPADYARLFSHFAAGKTADELWPDLRETWGRVCSLRTRHHFFHWPLEFPDVFSGSAGRGFSATVGNPPWDVLEPQSLEFYVDYDRNFLSLERAAAAKRIKELHAQHPTLDLKWASYEALFHEAADLCKEPAAYEALTKGKIDLYKAFLERFFQVLRQGGRLGVLCPSGLYTDESAIPLRKMLFERSALECLYSLSNERYMFANVHHAFRIVVLCARKGAETVEIKAGFAIDVRQAVSLQELDGAFAKWEARPLRIPIEAVRRFSNGALSLMEFNSQADADVVATLYGDLPTLGASLPKTWSAVLSKEYNITSDRGLYNQEQDGYVLYEGKMVSLFDHKFALPNYWMKVEFARNRELTSYWRVLHRKRRKPPSLDQEQYRVVYRKVAASTNERTMLSTIVPQNVSCPDSLMIVRRLVPDDDTGEPIEAINAGQSLFLCSMFNSFACDFAVRLKVTTNLDMHFIYSLPIPRLGSGDTKDATYFWPIVARALRLICTTDEYAALWAEVFSQLPAATLTALRTAPVTYGPAHEQTLRERLAESTAPLTAAWTPACGLHERKPDRRDDGDRAQTRAELDALVAHLYGLTKVEFAYILDTFPVLRRKELAAFGEYRSCRKALEEYDRFQTI